MSHPDQNPSATLFSGPSFHASGAQLVAEPGEVSLYLTATRHAFSANASQVRALNEVVARIILTPVGAARLRDMLNTYLAQLAEPAA